MVSGVPGPGVPCPNTGKLALLKFGERSNVDGNAGPGPVGVAADRFAYGLVPVKFVGGVDTTGDPICACNCCPKLDVG